MIIGVDAGCLGIKDERLKVGVYQVVFNLLFQLGKIDKKNNYRLYSFNPIEPKVMKQFGNRMENLVLHPARGWMQLRLPAEFLSRKPDVFLALGQAMPRFHPFKTIGFVYDLAFEFYPDCYPDSLAKLRKNTKYLVKKADYLVTISKSSKKDIIQLYNVPEQKIKVFYPGVGSTFTPHGQKHSLGASYFLFVGALKRLKNIPFIIKGFTKFLTQSKQNFYLVIAGGDLWFDPKISKTNPKIKLLGYVPEKNLPALYRGTMAFISPSLYEGFGMTLLEAMACGCPVITTDKGAMPEVVGKAGILVDPYNIDELVRAMKKISEDKSLRITIRDKGLKQGRQFTWEQFTQGILGVINEN